MDLVYVSWTLTQLSFWESWRREKRASIGALKREGIFQANKGLAFPLVPKRLAIISVETSKGLSDFYKIVQKNPWGYRLETTLYPAILQGERSIEAILGQLQIIASRLAQYDAVAIIRGGGAEVGLTSFNHYRLAKAVALFPLPVLTGIGHSTNETVTEMVAHINAITPSELADFVLQKFHAFSLLTDQAEEQLVRSARGLFALNIMTNWKGKPRKLAGALRLYCFSSMQNFARRKAD